MSRKREQQRESRRELARQLGVAPTLVPDALRAHARVTEPTLEVAFHVENAARGLFGRAGPLALHAVVYVVDGGGARVAQRVRCEGLARAAPCDVALTVVDAGGGERLRYTRPARFVVVVLATEGIDGVAAAAHGAALEDLPALAFDILDGSSSATSATTTLARASGAYFESPHAVRITHAGAPIVRADARFVAATIVCIPAAHRVHESRALPLESSDAKLRAHATLQLRL